MRSFGRFLKESKGGKNLHLEHLEDEILNGGINGARAAVNFLLSLRDMLKGESGRKMNMTVKWDGAPAVFAGTDPSDGKFFIAKKSVFNAVPLLYKSIAEIDADTKLSDTLKDKFKISFTEFSKLGIKGVLQGDLMFTNDTENKTLGGKDYVTFQPNTLIDELIIHSPDIVIAVERAVNNAEQDLRTSAKLSPPRKLVSCGIPLIRVKICSQCLQVSARIFLE